PHSLQNLLTGLLAVWLAGDALGEALRSIYKGDVHPRLRPYYDGEQGFAPEEAVRLWGASGLRIRSVSEGDGIAKVVRFPSPDLAPAWRRLAEMPAPGGLPLEPSSGFWGRGLELGLLEHALRDSKREGAIWIYGYEGLGKTTLAAHLARWLVRCGHFQQAVYTSFQGGGRAGLAVQHLGVRLLGARFAPASEDALDKVLDELAKTPTLVIWDNVEQLLPDGGFALEDRALEALWATAGRIARAGRSRLLLLSDGGEIPPRAYAALPIAFSLGLNPLAVEEALELLGHLLQKRPSLDEARTLIHALGEHPLALAVAAAALESRTVDKLLAELEDIFAGLRAGEARGRNQALEVMLEHLMRSFNPDLQLKLRALGLLPVGGIEPLFLRILHLEAEEWATCRARLAAAHLLQPLPLEGATVPYVHVHPALIRYLARRLSDAQRSGAVDPIYYSYMGLLNWLDGVDPQTRPIADQMVRAELPNLRRTLQLLLEHERFEQALTFTGHLAHFLERLGFVEERDAVRTMTQERIERAVSAEGPLPRTVVRFLLGQSERMVAMGAAPQAVATLQGLVERMNQEGGLAYSGDEAALDRGMALRRLGRIFHLSGRPDAAAAAYSQALTALHELKPDEMVRGELFPLYEHLAEMLLLMGQAEAARQVTEQGLQLAERVDDRHMQGIMTAQMGSVLVALGEVDQARERFEAALSYLDTEQDRLQAATVWSQKGMLAEAQDDLPEAERCYRQALELARAAEQEMFQAQILLQLARAADRRDDLAKAREHYVEALGIYTAKNLRAQMMNVQLSLADIALRQKDLDEARTYAEAARVLADVALRQKDLDEARIYDETAHALAEKMAPAGVWQPFVTLQRIAEAAGDHERAAEYRRRAQEIFARSPEALDVLKHWDTLIRSVVSSARGEALDQEAAATLEQLETNEAWTHLAGAIWRILGGERGEELYADLDHVDALVIRAILRGIEAPETEEESREEGPARQE
ncbi:MAG: tetratricopeptide repeat protein, partial [Chloroflexi bacterium]|nr:tetratricopeptide repeat protein [Chloroflexota bacterium]